MRVLQLIDSLHPGGAERMAVSLANALQYTLEDSFLCVTREEGVLKNQLSTAVPYLFLKKNKKVDVRALRTLNEFCAKNKITHIHTHGTSFFIATQLKMIRSTIKLVWHEHYGSRIATEGNQHKVLRFCSRYFDQIITVTPELKLWSEQHLKCPNVAYVKNFVNPFLFDSVSQRKNKIICVANLKQPKNHRYLLEAFAGVLPEFSDWELVLVGKIYDDAYYQDLVTFVSKNNLQHNVRFLGGDTDVKKELMDSKIGVLSSTYEGLPMVLLEYGAAGLLPITTDVGFCKDVIGTFGGVIPIGEVELFSSTLRAYLRDASRLKSDAQKYSAHISENYSVGVVIQQFINLYKNS